MPDDEHWTARADRVSNDPQIMGEDDRGLMWAPSRRREGWWDRPFSPWRPTHWPCWIRARRRNAVAFLERTDG